MFLVGTIVASALSSTARAQKLPSNESSSAPNTLVATSDLPPTELKLVCHGPVNQILFATIRYLKNGQTSKQLVTRIQLSESRQVLALEENYDAVRIHLQVPTLQPATAQLWQNQNIVCEATTTKVQDMELRCGNNFGSDELRFPSILLSQQDEETLTQFLNAISEANTQGIISPIEASLVNWQVLDRFSQTLIQSVGQVESPRTPVGNPDGWSCWEGNLNSRVLYGPVRFEHATYFLQLTHLHGRVVDVAWTGHDLPWGWLQLPINDQQYVQLARLLLEQLKLGQWQAAQSMFSHALKERITEAALEEVGNVFAAGRVGEISRIEWKKTSLLDGPEIDTKLLRISFVIQSKRGWKGIALVDFTIPISPGEVAKPHLTGVQAYPTWPTREPQSAVIVSETIESLFTADSKTWLDYMQPEIRDMSDASRLHEFHRHLIPQASSTDSNSQVLSDWDLWSAYETPTGQVVSGQLIAGDQTYSVRIELSNHRWNNITIDSQDGIFSTCDAIGEHADIAGQANEFWKSFFSFDQGATAGALSTDLIQSLGPTGLEDIFRKAGNYFNQPIVALRHEQLRWSEAAERESIAQLQCITSASFEDGSRHFFETIFETSDKEEAAWKIIHFDAAFNTVYPTRFPTKPVAEACEEFSSFEPARVLPLISKALLSEHSRPLLSAFLHSLEEQTQTIQAPESYRSWVRIENGRRFDEVAFETPGKSQTIPVRLTFDGDHLVAFYFDADGIGYFADQLIDEPSLPLLVEQFLNLWLSGDVGKAQGLMAREHQNAAVRQSLEALQTSLVGKYGPLSNINSGYATPSRWGNELFFEAAVEFKNGRAPIQLTVGIDALRAWIQEVIPVSATN